MRSLSRFTLADLTACSSSMRSMGLSAASMEETACNIVHFIYDNFIDEKTGERECVLVRLFKTHSYGELDNDLQSSAQAILGTTPESPAMKCLVLLATAGVRPEWRSRNHSRGHKAIPLPSKDFIKALPMIRQLLQQMGLEINTILKPDPAVVLDMAQKSYNVFCIPEAAGSKYVPVQDDFVIPFNVRSVLGFGGILPSGNLYTVIMFTKVSLPPETIQIFRSLALSVKLALLPFDGLTVFAKPGNQTKPNGALNK